MNFYITWFLVGRTIFFVLVIQKPMIKYLDIFPWAHKRKRANGEEKREGNFATTRYKKCLFKTINIWFTELSSKEETREWLREKSGEFCDHKIQKKCLFKTMNAWFTELSEVDWRKLIDELYILYKKNRCKNTTATQVEGKRNWDTVTHW